MPFSDYTTLGDALKGLQITSTTASFIVPMPMTISSYLQQEMDFVEKWVNVARSEFAICENLIYPVLKEVWKRYPDFQLWSHESLKFDDHLVSTPDYFLARRSPLGTAVREEPYLLIVEAKRDDFDWGWGQCLAAMVAAQKLNRWPEQVMYGITTIGRAWQFGRLQAGRLTVDPRLYSWRPLEEVCAAVNFIFEQCRQQLKVYAGAA